MSAAPTDEELAAMSQPDLLQWAIAFRKKADMMIERAAIDREAGSQALSMASRAASIHGAVLAASEKMQFGLGELERARSWPDCARPLKVKVRVDNGLDSLRRGWQQILAAVGLDGVV